MFRKTRNSVLRGCGVLAAAMIAAICTNAGNLVLDPSFENATALTTYEPGPIGDGWFVESGTILIDNFTDAIAPHSGSNAAYLDFANNPNLLSQDLATIPGQSYTISFWLADDSANPISVSFGADTLMMGNAPSNGVTDPSQYVQYIFDDVATDTSTTLSFTGFWSHGTGTFLDDVSVTSDAASTSGAPEPSTFLLMSAALAIMTAIALWRRNRRTRSTLRAIARLQ